VLCQNLLSLRIRSQQCSSSRHPLRAVKMVCLDARALAAIALVLLVNSSDAFAIAASGSKLAAARSTLRGRYHTDHWQSMLQPQYLPWLIRYCKHHVLIDLTQCLPQYCDCFEHQSSNFTNDNAFLLTSLNAVHYQQPVPLRQSA
jgi:hypothetical protein